MDERSAPVLILSLLWVVAGIPAAANVRDVCASCHVDATCDDKSDNSGKVCNCKYGFVGNGRTLCQDKDECQIGATKICGQHTTCHNTHGSYYCTCLHGYMASNNMPVFIPNDGTHCQDLDECSVSGLCGQGAQCRNLNGSFDCSCQLGYRVQDGKEPFHPLKDQASCKVVDCGPPVLQDYTVLLSTTGTTYRSMATFDCDEGSVKRSGNNVSLCGADGLWTETTLVCEEISCGPPQALPHTNLQWDRSTRPGSAVLYKCMGGYYQEGGDDISTCLTSGEWAKVSLKCKAKCGPVPMLAHSDVVWNNRSVVIHRCANGYHSWRGSNISLCSSSGVWQTATLQCIEIKPPIDHLNVSDEKCVQWRAEKYEEDTETYKVFYMGSRDYDGTFLEKRKRFLSSQAEWLKVCLSLLPATNYSISITAMSTGFTATITTNTSLPVPLVPDVHYREYESPAPNLRLHRSPSTLDPISLYQVFVLPIDGMMTFDCSSPANGDALSKQDSLTRHIAAQMHISHVGADMNFTVGDGLYRGGFFNAPLEKGRNYYVVLRVVSRWNKDLKSSCVLWAKVTGTSYVVKVSSLCAAATVGLIALAASLGHAYTWWRLVQGVHRLPPECS
ncbi:sushi domain-containing protein 1 isoform X6 [Nerophis lumbriciformis]|uniref:sushi domain-containing protein 1 isoform X6 n=1 Tax=Nerophis lumbriciformis TaxID=546530 RepID=UPI002ADF3BCD|nr:sushi domain-containing protein 1 isoform X8 [Nerophis lumbriciformis]